CDDAGVKPKKMGTKTRLESAKPTPRGSWGVDRGSWGAPKRSTRGSLPPPALRGARERIDKLDDEILERLAQRADIAREIAAVKRAADVAIFHDPERESVVLDRLVDKGGRRFPANAIRAVFREVMSACLSVEEPLRVAYLGPEGTFTQL